MVTEKHLDENPQFYRAGGKKTFWQALKAMAAKVGIKNNEPAQANIQGEIAAGSDGLEDPEELKKKRIKGCIGILEGGLGVEPVKETRALRISFNHTDPKIAAEVTNAVANTFLDRNFETRPRVFRGAAKWLDESTRKLKAKVEEADQALKDYERDMGSSPRIKTAR